MLELLDVNFIKVNCLTVIACPTGRRSLDWRDWQRKLEDVFVPISLLAYPPV